MYHTLTDENGLLRYVIALPIHINVSRCDGTNVPFLVGIMYHEVMK